MEVMAAIGEIMKTEVVAGGEEGVAMALRAILVLKREYLEPQVKGKSIHYSIKGVYRQKKPNIHLTFMNVEQTHCLDLL